VTGRLKFRIFAHSWISDWNHGNAHFLRGLANELVGLGHEVRCYEDECCWSAQHLREDEGRAVADATMRHFQESFPALDVRFYGNDSRFAAFAEEQLQDADVAIVHEWNDLRIIQSILALKSKCGFKAIFHDTHHRSYTSPEQILRIPLHRFDGVLAFGEAIRRIYRDGFGVQRTWTLQEAADTVHFRPLAAEKETDIVWVGNWGDEERTAELQEFFIGPAMGMRDRKIAVYGVRYPESALKRLASAGIQYRGYLPNLEAPRSYASSVLSVHVPRRCYANGLGGIPTIRMFEAMACGSPLICSPWTDSEGLFRAGEDYISVRNGRAMSAEIRNLLRDDEAQRQLARNGRETIMARHTCAHRAAELVQICEELGK
jgi:spore maturation protein CgeB